MIKYYKTNRLKSVLFYVSILLPFLIIFLTFVELRYSRDYWDILPLLFFYIFALPMEFVAIKYWEAEIAIDDNVIQIKQGGKFSRSSWNEIVKFEVSLFNWGWELSYRLVTKDKKILGFGDSIENYKDLVKEIGDRTGLKLKKTL